MVLKSPATIREKKEWPKSYTGAINTSQEKIHGPKATDDCHLTFQDKIK